MASTTYSLVMSTFPNQSSAETVAFKLTELGLVACTNITPLLTSIYIWNGRITQASEVLVLMKTKQEKLAELEKVLLENHPYETPEFISLPIEYGSLNYLKWMDKVMKPL